MRVSVFLSNQRRSLSLGLAVPAVLLGIACNSRPSEKLLEAFKQKEKFTLPGLMVTKAMDDGMMAYDEVPYNTAYNTKLREVMEVLGNDLGFRVEVATRQTGGPFFRSNLKAYRVVSVTPKALPGLSIKQDGSIWNLLVDYKDEVVVEKATSADKGVEQWMEETRKEDFKTLKGELLAASKADAAKKVAAFQQNVGRIQKDLGAKRAWWVEFRHRPSTNLPPESPVWNLTTALLEAPVVQTSGTTVPLATMSLPVLTHASFFKNKGQVNLKENLQSYVCVLFEGQDGGLLKGEGFKTFMQ